VETPLSGPRIVALSSGRGRGSARTCKNPRRPTVVASGAAGGALYDEAELAPINDERAVVAALKRGDRQAAGTLYAWYGDCLFREVVLPRLPVRELAEDVLRDTFRLVLERIEQYRPEENKSIYFWIRRIAINRATDVWRAWQRSRRLEDAVEAESRVHGESMAPDEGLEQDERRAAIEEALTQINPRYAEALKLRLLDDLEREDCAARMGVTVGNFDVILHRACAAFRKVYTPE
jgi:RNA polymerase sigma-70 factor (ECF subfamily)